MNEQLQESLASILSSFLGTLESGVSFLSAEVPLVITEILQWYMILGLIRFTFALSLLVGAYQYWQWVRRSWEAWGEKRDAREAPVIAGIIGSLIFSATFMVQINLEWLKIWVAPKLWLIEYAADLAAKAT